MKRINRQEAYSLHGARANYAEEYFSRLRGSETGIHHHIAGANPLHYARESSWREDKRRASSLRLTDLRDDEEVLLICPTCQVCAQASVPATACYFAWGCFRYFLVGSQNRVSLAAVESKSRI